MYIMHLTNKSTPYSVIFHIRGRGGKGGRGGKRSTCSKRFQRPSFCTVYFFGPPGKKTGHRFLLFRGFLWGRGDGIPWPWSVLCRFFAFFLRFVRLLSPPPPLDALYCAGVGYGRDDGYGMGDMGDMVCTRRVVVREVREVREVY